jgi:hypothetical protein
MSSDKIDQLGDVVSGFQVADMTVLVSNASYRTLRADDLTRVPTGVDNGGGRHQIELLDALDGLGRCGADSASRGPPPTSVACAGAKPAYGAHDVPSVESAPRVGKAKRAHAVAPEPGPCRHGAKSAFAYPSCYTFLATGTGMPGIFTLTDPSMVRLVKNSVFQSSPPKAILVVAGWP